VKGESRHESSFVPIGVQTEQLKWKRRSFVGGDQMSTGGKKKKYTINWRGREAREGLGTGQQPKHPPQQKPKNPPNRVQSAVRRSLEGVDVSKPKKKPFFPWPGRQFQPRFEGPDHNGSKGGKKWWGDGGFRRVSFWCCFQVKGNRQQKGGGGRKQMWGANRPS